MVTLAADATINPTACPTTSAKIDRVKIVTPEFSTANPLINATTKKLSAINVEIVFVSWGVVTIGSSLVGVTPGLTRGQHRLLPKQTESISTKLRGLRVLGPTNQFKRFDLDPRDDLVVTKHARCRREWLDHLPNNRTNAWRSDHDRGCTTR